MLGTQAQAASRSVSSALRAGRLPRRDVEVIEQVGCGEMRETSHSNPPNLLNVMGSKWG